jgi:hypothetical protein
MQSLVDCVLLDPEDMCDLGAGKAIPGGQADQLSICCAHPIERHQDQVDVATGRRTSVRIVYSDAGEGVETCRQPGSTATTSVVVGHHPIGNAIEPGSRRVTGRQLVETTPGHGEHVGRRILGVGSAQSSGAVPVDSVVVSLEERVEAKPEIGLIIDSIASGHICLSAMLCVRWHRDPYTAA